MFGRGACRESGLQFAEKVAAVLVALDSGIIGGGEHAAQIAQIEVVEIALGGFGTIEPIGDPQTRDQILSHLEHALLGHGGLALGGQCLVRGLQPLTNRLHALQGELGDGSLVLGQIGEYRLAML